MATVVSDNPAATKFARSKRGGGAEIVILKNPASGNVQIFTAKRSRIDLRDTAQIIRIMEQQANGEMKTTQFFQLGAEGKVSGAEAWFYHFEGQMLLNGSLNATDVPPTRLPRKKIQLAVRLN